MHDIADHDPLDLQGQEAARLKAEEAEAHRRRIELEDLRWLMSDKRGRRFMHRLLSRAHLYHSSFTGEPHSTAFKEGERNVGLTFLADVMEACPDRYTAMQQESRLDGTEQPGDRRSKRR